MRQKLTIIVTALALCGACNNKPDAGAALAQPASDCAKIALAYSGSALTATIAVNGGAPVMVVLGCDAAGVCAQVSGGLALQISGATGQRGACEAVCAGAGLTGTCARVVLPSTHKCLAPAPAVCRKVGS